MFSHRPLGAPRVTPEVGVGRSETQRNQKKQTKHKANQVRTGRSRQPDGGLCRGPGALLDPAGPRHKGAPVRTAPQECPAQGVHAAPPGSSQGTHIGPLCCGRGAWRPTSAPVALHFKGTRGMRLGAVFPGGLSHQTGSGHRPGGDGTGGRLPAWPGPPWCNPRAVAQRLGGPSPSWLKAAPGALLQDWECSCNARVSPVKKALPGAPTDQAKGAMVRTPPPSTPLSQSWGFETPGLAIHS